MVRCPRCGHMVKWSAIPIQPCTHCGQFIVMPTRDEARLRGILDGVLQPYNWELDQPEVALIFDGLDCLMDTFQQGLQGHNNDEAVEALSGSYVFAKMTRARLRALVPDMQEEVEKR